MREGGREGVRGWVSEGGRKGREGGEGGEGGRGWTSMQEWRWERCSI